MRRFVQKATVWGLAGLFGCISLFGSGWHALVPHSHAGCEHASLPRQASAKLSTCLEHAHCAGHDPISARRQARTQHSAPSKTRSTGPTFAPITHDHDCAICGFFAQAQWTAPVDLPLEQSGITRILSLKTPSFRAEILGSYRSRAPPAGALAS